MASSSSSSTSSETNKIILTSSDGASFELDEPVARELQIVAHMIEDDCANKAIPLANVTGDILSIVIEYCKKHVEEEEDEAKKKKLDEWDTDFVKDFDLDLMFQVILAANYLNIKGLLELTCQSVADRIKDKSPEEIRVIFNVENDYTPEEEAEVRKQNEWAFN